MAKTLGYALEVGQQYAKSMITCSSYSAMRVSKLAMRSCRRHIQRTRKYFGNKACLNIRVSVPETIKFEYIGYTSLGCRRCGDPTVSVQGSHAYRGYTSSSSSSSPSVLISPHRAIGRIRLIRFKQRLRSHGASLHSRV